MGTGFLVASDVVKSQTLAYGFVEHLFGLRGRSPWVAVKVTDGARAKISKRTSPLCQTASTCFMNAIRLCCEILLK